MPRDPTAEAIRNLILLQRLSNGIAGDVSARLSALFDEIIGELVKRDPTSVLPRYRRSRIERIMREVETLVGDAYQEVLRSVRQSLAQVGAQQGGQAANTLRGAVGYGIDIKRPMGINLTKAIIDRDPFMGLVMADQFADMDRRTVLNVQRRIQIGMLNSEPIDAIVRRVRGRSNGRGGFVGGVLDVSTREAEAVVRTAVNHISNTAHMRTYRENADVVTKVQFVATLDSRTSDICIANDGKTWDVDDDTIPRPPLHYNCRSTLVPIVDWEGLGIEPPPEGTRASRGGQVPASTDYEGWLKTQDEAVQVDVLGKAKTARFRAGEPLSRLIKADRGVVRLSGGMAAR